LAQAAPTAGRAAAARAPLWQGPGGRAQPPLCEASPSWMGIFPAVAALTLHTCTATLQSVEDMLYDTPPARPSWTLNQDMAVCKDRSVSEEPYEPLCPPGFYLCCATCSRSSCYSTEDAVLSWRGLPECLLCEAGDFCSGCDMFKVCPPNEQPGREGPRISQRGTSQIVECETCPLGQEASFSRDACAPKYTDVCNEKAVQRCIRGCRSDIPANGKKLTECEYMKCSMYCTKAWSDECAARYSEHCTFLVNEKFATGLGVESDVPRLYGCDVDCSGTRSLRLAPAASAALALAVLVGR